MKTSLNYTSFTNPVVAAKILGAMREVLTKGTAVRLQNRRGQPWLLVTVARDALGYHFEYLDAEGNDLSKMILKAAQHWPDDNFLRYWELNAQPYDMVEHPFMTATRKAREAELEESRKMFLLVEGVTHTVHSWGGSVMLGAYQRDWLGRKRLWIFIEASAQWHKASPEFLAGVRHVERFQ